MQHAIVMIKEAPAGRVRNATLEDGEFGELLSEATQHRDALADVMERMQCATDRIEVDLPRLELPSAITGEPPAPLVSSVMQLHEAIRVLRERKDYAPTR